MSRLFLFASLSIVLAVGVMLMGCSNQPSNQPPNDRPDAAQTEPAATDHSEHQGHDHGGNAHSGHDASGHASHGGHGQYAEAMAKLSPADRALAEKQEVCPVSGEPLGSMGTPYKVTVQGQEVLLCCPGCEAEIRNNPEKYLAKVSQ